MKLHSLQLRLLAAASLSVSAALLLAGWGLLNLFEAHVERRFDNELKAHLRQLVGGIEIRSDDRIYREVNLADPRFAQPFSGLYWQIQDNSHATLLRSRSLWDQTLHLPPDELLPGEAHKHQLPGPLQQTLLIREQQIILGSKSTPRQLRIAVAMDIKDIQLATQAFATDMWPYLGILAVFLMLASALQVLVGLSPMKRVRDSVFAVRSGNSARLEGGFPEEVTPLIDEINMLLEAAEKAVDKARSWTGDLAHGLKTPLTALSADAQQLRKQGHEDIATRLEPLIEAMRIRLDRELVRARIYSHTSSPIYRSRERTDLHKILTGVQSTLARTPDGQALKWPTELPDKLPSVDMHPSDLSELLGNLLDNAGKWAQSQVLVQVQVKGEGWQLCIHDDGQGVAVQELALLGQRGLRLDESIGGHGLGLAIVRDICEAYNVPLHFSQSVLGGLAVCVTLPMYSQ